MLSPDLSVYRSSRSPPSRLQQLPSVTHTHISLIHHLSSLKASHLLSTRDLHSPIGPRVHSAMPLPKRAATKRAMQVPTRAKVTPPARAAGAESIRNARDDGQAPKPRGVVTCGVRGKHRRSTAHKNAIERVAVRAYAHACAPHVCSM